ncbi:ParB/RepB/Spo0J family partition protein [Streptomyces sp. NPDC057910]|uniref:ParB/RepB/Spo0J family partition protein n=1 Tax=Streptomyces sp. NPDC057910 TaxID=3346278 RepID=UPI0036E4AFEC
MNRRSNAADRVGPSSSFSSAAKGTSLRGQLIANATGVPAQLRTPELALDLISENPDNPRESLPDLSGLASSLAEVGLVNAITVASVEAWLQDRSGRENELRAGAQYVVIDGHRRLAAAREAGLATIKVTFNDELATTDESMLEAAYVASAQHEHLSELEEAVALEKLVEFYGSQHKAAARLGITQAVISQRLSLLKLSPELQADLGEGRRQVKHVRGLAKLSPEEQRAAADGRAQQDAEAAQARKVKRAAAGTRSAGDNPVITAVGVTGAVGPAKPSDNPVITGPVDEVAPGDDAPVGDNPVVTDAEPNAAGHLDIPGPRLPWQSPQDLDRLLRDHMTSDDRRTLARLLALD